MKLRFYLRGLGIGMAVTAVILHFAVATKSHAMSDDEIRARAAQLGMSEGAAMLVESGRAGEDSVSVSGNGAAEQSGLARADAAQSGQELQLADASEGEEAPFAAGEQGEGEDTTEGAEPTASASEEEETESTARENDAATDASESGDTQSGGATDTTGSGNTQGGGATDTTGNGNTQSGGAGGTTGSGTTGTGTAQSGGAADASETGETQPTSAVGGNVSHGLNAESVTITVVKGDSSYTVARRLAEAGVVPSAAEFDEFLCRNNYDRTLAVGVHTIPSGASYDEMGRILTGR